MEKLKKKIFTVMISIFMLYSLLSFFNQPSYATNETTGSEVTETNETGEQENQTEENESNTSKNEVNNNTETETPTTTTTTKTEAKKSSNARLKNLGIRPHDFSGFKAGTTTYNVTVPSDTESVEVYATAQDSSARISGTGTKKLEIGKNTLEVVVTAEDGTKQTYTINVTRQESEEENTENVQERYSGDGLASLKIGDLELSPKFDTNVYEYTVKYIGEDETLNVEIETTDPYYETEIVGNNNLKEGENIITILVSDPDGNNVATYQVTVNKSLVDEEALAREQAERERQEQMKYLIIGGVVIVVIIIISIILIVRHRKNRILAEDYSVPFSGLNDKQENNQLEDYDENMNEIKNKDINEDLPKEQARKEFLDNYNMDNSEDYEETEETLKRKRHKGKRFK